ncbi:hypothetical protein DS6A_94 [Mycobacterium phage DS6A]|uniref:Uncharacterized protein n=1 Tax=Mycobacterium phage DS6A TaxID=45764 RepID=G8I4K4_9CAUD|nr:hypothetical protein DS6A_94 [Mycobacterium phage DS6A]AER47648.1 hypothetical protein DS6A_94 [Mycobacterium phage DS6A]
MNTTTAPGPNRTQLFQVYDEADRYLYVDATVLRREWRAVLNWAQDGIDRDGTEHAMSRAEWTELFTHVRRLRGAEGAAQGI